MPLKLLSLQNVSFSYPDGETVLSDITMDIHQKDLIIVRGESGAGKSTFLKLFNRFCDYKSGRIYFHGKDLKQYKVDRLRGSIIYLPQLPIVIEGSIADNLSFPFSFYSHRNHSFNRVKAAEWLDYFQLNLPMQHDAFKLSIGQKQRIALIRSMLLEPDVLLLDEPGSALDNKNKRLIESKIEHLIDSSKVTVFMATHGDVSFKSADCRTFSLENKKLRIIA